MERFEIFTHLAYFVLVILIFDRAKVFSEISQPINISKKNVDKECSPGFGFLLTMPQVLQAGSTERYCISFRGSEQDVELTLELSEVERMVVERYTYIYSTNGGNVCNSFKVPNASGSYEVKLRNDSVIFSTSKVQVLQNRLVTFLQTDKPIYKPGQKVKIRVLSMDFNLLSSRGLIDQMTIFDPNDYKVKQYRNITFKGMADMEFQLIDDAKLGDWKIVLDVEGQLTTQQFKVQEYVLPRFEVTITTGSYFLVTNETFNSRVCAFYTFGMPVDGFAYLEVCPTSYGFNYNCTNRRAEINGCYDFSINSTEILFYDRYFFNTYLNVKASVREKDTGVLVNKSAEGPKISKNPLNINFGDINNGHFKPGLPIDGKLTVSLPNGRPAVNESVLVKARDYANNVYLSGKFTSNQFGEIKFSVCSRIKENTATLHLSAESLNYKGLNNEVNARRLYRPTASHFLRQWFSPSFSYLQLPPPKRSYMCGESINITVPFTHAGLKPFIHFHYQVMARGRILQSGSVNSTVTMTETDAFRTIHPTFDINKDTLSNITVTPRPPLPTICLQETFDVSPSPLPSWSTSPTLARSGSSGGARVTPGGPTKSKKPAILLNSSESQWLPRRSALVEETPLYTTSSKPISRGSPNSKPFKEAFDNTRKELDRPRRSIFPYFEKNKAEEIVRSEDVSKYISIVELNLHVIAEMTPAFSLLVFYIRDDGEVVADSKEYGTEPCFYNKVKMEFSESSVAPGDETTIHLEAAAGSLCGIGVVDRSVNILGGDHQLTQEKVFKKLSEYSLSQYNGYSYYRSDNSYCQEKLSLKEKKANPETQTNVLAENSNDDINEEQPSIVEVNSTNVNPAVQAFIPHYNAWYMSHYVDSIEAFKQMGMLIMTNLVVETRPCSEGVHIYFDNGGMPGPIPMAMQYGPPTDITHNSGDDKIRSNFPETWLWDLETIGENGVLDINRIVPDTITQWTGNSLCVSDNAGFGLSPLVHLTTFKPFFLAFTLPYNAVRGERLPITITVYNYLEKCLHLILKVDGYDGFRIDSGRNPTRPFCVCGGKSKTYKFFITAQDIGYLPIYAKAEIIPGACETSSRMDLDYIGKSDTVQRLVYVKAEGVTQRYCHSIYICPDDHVYRDSFELPVPQDIVSGSVRGYVTIIGDIMGPALSNMDSLVRMPTGCGEQNMVGFTPNIYVLKYLSSTGQLTDEIQEKAKHHMEIGYQRELKYQHLNGAYSAYGESDMSKNGSTWLTAFVVKSFAQARPYIFIDDEELKKSITYLKECQFPEGAPYAGCFNEHGMVFSSYMQGGLGRGGKSVALSAYVLVSLLQAGFDPQDETAVHAIDCINREVDYYEDTYTLALVTYANALYDPTSAFTSNAMSILEGIASVDGGVKYWKRKGQQPPPINSWYYPSAPSAEVEMTSYALLSMLHVYGYESLSMAQPVVFWLSNQQSAFGGFSSTQDTVVGLNALSEFAALSYTNDTKQDLQVIVGSSGPYSFEKTFHVNDRNALELQRYDYNVSEHGMSNYVSALGTGCALVQANVKYNKMPDKLGIVDPQFTLRVEPRLYQFNRNLCHRRTLEISYGRLGASQYSVGMTILAVRMVTGWEPVPQSLQALRSIFPILGIEKYEFDKQSGLLTFYLDQLDEATSKTMKLDVEQDKDLAVSAPKPAEVQIYQYYENDVTVVKPYRLRTTCGTKQEIPFHNEDNRNDVLEQRRSSFSWSPNDFKIPQAEGVNLTAAHCPVCGLQEIPDNLQEIVCNSSAVYLAKVRRNGNSSVNIKFQYRHGKKIKKNVLVKYAIESGCTCIAMNFPKTQVLIITQKDALQNALLKLNWQTHVFEINALKRLMKQMRKIQRKCQ